MAKTLAEGRRPGSGRPPNPENLIQRQNPIVPNGNDSIFIPNLSGVKNQDDSIKTSAYTAGSVLFSNGSKITEDNSNFFWDDTNNRLGLGTNSPSVSLHVLHATENILATFESGDANAGIRLKDDSTTVGQLLRAKGDDLQFFSGAGPTHTMTLDSSNNVGIGTESPGELLDVSAALSGSAGSYSGEPVIRLTQTRNTNYNIGDIHSAIEFYSDDTGGDYPGIQAYIKTVTTRADNIGVPDAGLVFGTSNNNDPGDLAQDRMILTGAGNVGIGTTSPGSLLSVNGSGGAGGGGPASVLVTPTDDSSNVWGINTIDASLSTGNNIINLIGVETATDNAGYIGFHYTGDHSTSNYLRFGMFGSDDLMTIQADGNVGIGDTSPDAKLDVNGTIKLAEQAAAGADTAGKGQLWVKNTTPCELWFTDDAGTDTQIV